MLRGDVGHARAAWVAPPRRDDGRQPLKNQNLLNGVIVYVRPKNTYVFIHNTDIASQSGAPGQATGTSLAPCFANMDVFNPGQWATLVEGQQVRYIAQVIVRHGRAFKLRATWVSTELVVDGEDDPINGNDGADECLHENSDDEWLDDDGEGWDFTKEAVARRAEEQRKRDEESECGGNDEALDLESDEESEEEGEEAVEEVVEEEEVERLKEEVEVTPPWKQQRTSYSKR